MTYLEENRIRKEVRGLRQRMAIVERAWQSQKTKNKQLESELRQAKQENRKLKIKLKLLQTPFTSG